MSGNPAPAFAEELATLNKKIVHAAVRFNPNGASDPATSTVSGPPGTTVTKHANTGQYTVTLSPQSESYYPSSRNRKIKFNKIVAFADGMQRAAAGAGSQIELVDEITSAGVFNVRYLLNAAGTFSANNVGPTSGTVIHLMLDLEVEEVIAP